MKRESKQKMGRIPLRMTAVILRSIRKRMMEVTRQPMLVRQTMKRLKSSKMRKTRVRNRKILMKKKSWLL